MNQREIEKPRISSGLGSNSRNAAADDAIANGDIYVTNWRPDGYKNVARDSELLTSVRPYSWDGMEEPKVRLALEKGEAVTRVVVGRRRWRLAKNHFGNILISEFHGID